MGTEANSGIPAEQDPSQGAGTETVTPERGAGGPEQGSEEQAFFDATKVPAELQPTFREMQSAWTKKVQEVAPFRKALEAYGSPDEALQMLSQLQTQEGMLDWWYQVSEELGLDPAELIKSLSGEASKGAPTAPAGATQPSSTPGSEEPPAWFQEYLQTQQEQARQSQEDQEISSALGSLKVPEAYHRAVIAEAIQQPEHLSLTERIKRGYGQVQAMLDSHTSSATGKTVGKVPAPMAGGPGIPKPDQPKSLDEAQAAARELLKGLRED